MGVYIPYSAPEHAWHAQPPTRQHGDAALQPAGCGWLCVPSPTLLHAATLRLLAGKARVPPQAKAKAGGASRFKGQAGTPARPVATAGNAASASPFAGPAATAPIE